MTDMQRMDDPPITSTAETLQKVIALDASYLHQRSRAAPHLNPERWNLYLRRRYQLSQNAAPSFPVDRSEYLYIRQNLLTQKYGPNSRSSSNAGTVTPTTGTTLYDMLLLDRQQRHPPSRLSSSSSSSTSQLPLAESSLRRKIENEAPVSKGYAFAGIETIFDHHKDTITRIRFAHNDSHRLAIASADGTASICHISEATGEEVAVSHKVDYFEPPVPDSTPTSVSPFPPAALMDIAWSLANDFVATVSLDASLCLWDVQRQGCLTRHFRDVASPGGGLLVCEFHPINNNYLVLGDTLGLVQVLNLSTGRVVKNGRDKLHTPPRMRIRLPPCRNRTDLSHYLGRGCVTALAFDPHSCRLWVGTDLGVIQAYSCNEATGALARLSRLTVPPPPSTPLLPTVTSLAFCSWLSHEDSSCYLLVNAAGVGLLLYHAQPDNGKLELHQHFELPHSPLCNPPVTNYGLHLLHSCFAPLISFRSSGTACVISASEDRGSVYVFEVSTNATYYTQDRKRSGAVVTRLQGHDCEVGRTVTDVTLSWDESFLASADEAGVVILWRRQAAN
ncbi:WD repeat-containing protein 13 [Echinococcus granulosus]|uniref:WD repeat containing protein 13 n=1 Tax=Echinococcus granulosus TaxID=6210 RepID=U6J7R5_ECHGR|nr:WD repeat-containing protein [Echinococcus granulosus]EUB62323.1 WD repeat-containing protein [Echinococcus granulosus]KAH9281636.1 WD repeat-containing protein 13 [Echinococcus granulosus]CDS18467.1 WD repeat containing protein 13 [Echinococcus granulosus]